MGQRTFYLTRGLNEIHRIVAVILDPGGDSEDIGIEDDVLGWKACFVGQDVIASRTDLHFTVPGISLSLFIEGHDNDGGTVTPDLAGMFDEGLFAFLQTDGVDDSLTLQAFQPLLQYRPLR